MTISVTIKHNEPAGSTTRLTVEVVTVGNLEEASVKHVLAPQEAIEVQVSTGQFLMVDESDSKELT
jgi:hypothetical protein